MLHPFTTRSQEPTQTVEEAHGVIPTLSGLPDNELKFVANAFGWDDDLANDEQFDPADFARNQEEAELDDVRREYEADCFAA